MATSAELRELEQYEKDSDEDSGEDALMGLYDELNQADENIGNKSDVNVKKEEIATDKSPFLTYGIGIQNYFIL